MSRGPPTSVKLMRRLPFSFPCSPACSTIQSLGCRSRALQPPPRPFALCHCQKCLSPQPQLLLLPNDRPLSAKYRGSAWTSQLVDSPWSVEITYICIFIANTRKPRNSHSLRDASACPTSPAQRPLGNLDVQALFNQFPPLHSPSFFPSHPSSSSSPHNHSAPQPHVLTLLSTPYLQQMLRNSIQQVFPGT